VAYSCQLQATGGTPPYTWSLPSDVLPRGLTLNASTGLIGGIPQETSSPTSIMFISAKKKRTKIKQKSLMAAKQRQQMIK